MQIIKIIIKLTLIAAISTLAACGDIEPTGVEADLVVYGNIYTSETDNLHASAFAVKDGKYIYVGDKDGAKGYVGSDTQVINHTSGMVMAGCTEGHGHYITEAIFKKLCYIQSESYEDCLQEIKKPRFK